MSKQLRDCPSCGQKEGVTVETSFKKDSRDWVVGIQQKISKCSSCGQLHTMDEKFYLIKYDKEI